MRIFLLSFLFLLSCTYPYKDQPKINSLKDEIMSLCYDVDNLSRQDIVIDKKEDFIIASIDKKPGIYFLCFLEGKKYEYIVFSKLYEGGNYFDINNDSLHEELLNLNNDLKQYGLCISKIYSDGVARIIDYTGRWNYCMIQLPFDFNNINNRDSLKLIDCIINEDCKEWTDFQLSIEQ